MALSSNKTLEAPVECGRFHVTHVFTHNPGRCSADQTVSRIKDLLEGVPAEDARRIELLIEEIRLGTGVKIEMTPDARRNPTGEKHFIEINQPIGVMSKEWLVSRKQLCLLADQAAAQLADPRKIYREQDRELRYSLIRTMKDLGFLYGKPDKVINRVSSVNRVSCSRQMTAHTVILSDSQGGTMFRNGFLAPGVVGFVFPGLTFREIKKLIPKATQLFPFLEMLIICATTNDALKDNRLQELKRNHGMGGIHTSATPTNHYIYDMATKLTQEFISTRAPANVRLVLVPSPMVGNIQNGLSQALAVYLSEQLFEVGGEGNRYWFNPNGVLVVIPSLVYGYTWAEPEVHVLPNKWNLFLAEVQQIINQAIEAPRQENLVDFGMEVTLLRSANSAVTHAILMDLCIKERFNKKENMSGRALHRILIDEERVHNFNWNCAMDNINLMKHPIPYRNSYLWKGDAQILSEWKWSNTLKKKIEEVEIVDDEQHLEILKQEVRKTGEVNIWEDLEPREEVIPNIGITQDEMTNELMKMLRMAREKFTSLHSFHALIIRNFKTFGAGESSINGREMKFFFEGNHYWEQALYDTVAGKVQKIDNPRSNGKEIGAARLRDLIAIHAIVGEDDFVLGPNHVRNLYAKTKKEKAARTLSTGDRCFLACLVSANAAGMFFGLSFIEKESMQRIRRAAGIRVIQMERELRRPVCLADLMIYFGMYAQGVEELLGASRFRSICGVWKQDSMAIPWESWKNMEAIFDPARYVSGYNYRRMPWEDYLRQHSHHMFPTEAVIITNEAFDLRCNVVSLTHQMRGILEYNTEISGFLHVKKAILTYAVEVVKRKEEMTRQEIHGEHAAPLTSVGMAALPTDFPESWRNMASFYLNCENDVLNNKTFAREQISQGDGVKRQVVLPDDLRKICMANWSAADQNEITLLDSQTKLDYELAELARVHNVLLHGAVTIPPQDVRGKENPTSRPGSRGTSSANSSPRMSQKSQRSSPDRESSPKRHQREDQENASRPGSSQAQEELEGLRATIFNLFTQASQRTFQDAARAAQQINPAGVGLSMSGVQVVPQVPQDQSFGLDKEHLDMLYGRFKRVVSVVGQEAKQATKDREEWHGRCVMEPIVPAATELVYEMEQSRQEEKERVATLLPILEESSAQQAERYAQNEVEDREEESRLLTPQLLPDTAVTALHEGRVAEEESQDASLQMEDPDDMTTLLMDFDETDLEFREPLGVCPHPILMPALGNPTFLTGDYIVEPPRIPGPVGEALQRVRQNTKERPLQTVTRDLSNLVAPTLSCEELKGRVRFLTPGLQLSIHPCEKERAILMSLHEPTRKWLIYLKGG